MSTISDIAAAIDAKIESASAGLNVTAALGYPDYARTDLVAPRAFYWFVRHEPVEARTVGRPMGHRWRTTFSVAVYAQDEKRLCDYVSTYGTMFRNWTSDTISTKYMTISTSALERIEDESGTIQLLRYATGAQITFDYEV